jgi:hypothetical protein
MKRLIIIVLALLMAVPVVDARRRKKPAGDIEGSTYTDNKYGFTMKIDDNWKARIQENDSHTRLILTQKNYAIPTYYATTPDYTAVPRFVIWADTVSMGVFPFIDSLLSETYESDQKNDMMNEFEFFREDDITPRGRSSFELDSARGVAWTGVAKYVKEVQSSAGAVGGKRVGGGYGAAVMAAKKDSLMVVMYMMCEEDYFDAVLVEIKNMVDNFHWSAEKQSDKKQEEG